MEQQYPSNAFDKLERLYENADFDEAWAIHDIYDDNVTITFDEAANKYDQEQAEAKGYGDFEYEKVKKAERWLGRRNAYINKQYSESEHISDHDINALLASPADESFFADETKDPYESDPEMLGTAIGKHMYITQQIENLNPAYIETFAGIEMRLRRDSNLTWYDRTLELERNHVLERVLIPIVDSLIEKSEDKDENGPVYVQLGFFVDSETIGPKRVMQKATENYEETYVIDEYDATGQYNVDNMQAQPSRSFYIYKYSEFPSVANEVIYEYREDSIKIDEVHFDVVRAMDLAIELTRNS
jgi:hypothetical protein